MPKFKVGVCRTGYGFASFEVEAKDETEAKRLADEQAEQFGRVVVDHDDY